MQNELENQYQAHFKNAMNTALSDSNRVHHLEFMRAIGIAKSMLDFIEEQILEEMKGDEDGES